MKRKPKAKDSFAYVPLKKGEPFNPTFVAACASCLGKDATIEAQAAHIRSLERQLEIVANLADPMVQARVAAVKGEIAVPVLGTPEMIASALKAKQPNNPRRWREPETGPQKPGKPDTPPPELDPEGEFENALRQANEAEAETQGPRPS